MDERSNHPTPSAIRLTGHLPTLDGWRGVAVLMVIASHAFGATWLRVGELGVSIFFALSGLLICNRLLAEADSGGRVSLRAFYVRRAFRILPPALIFLIVLAILDVPASRRELWSCALFWRNYFLDGGWYTGHFWSLAVEEHFYLIFPIMLVLAGPRRRLAIVAAVVLALIAWRLIDEQWPCPIDRISAVRQYYRSDCRLADLLLGSLTMLLAARLPRRAIRVAAIVGGLVVLAVLCQRRLPWPAVSLPLPWLLLGTVLRPNGFAGRALEWPLLARVGRMSYSLYIWQQLFFDPHQSIRSTGLAWMQDWPWNLVGLAVVATATHLVVERPLTALGRRLAKSVGGRKHLRVGRISYVDRRAA
jgi:peptidoglycan/LPS O-acetylase OafA/YrhL